MDKYYEKAFDVIGGMETLKGFADDVIRVRSEIQQLEISFASLLQSKEKADILVSQMVAVAAQSPFELKTLSNFFGVSHSYLLDGIPPSEDLEKYPDLLP